MHRDEITSLVSNDPGSLARGKRSSRRILDRAAWRTLSTVSLRERSLLRLVFHRGASQQELAGVLGISRTHLRRILERAVDRATDPMQQALVGVWRLLTPEEQRLAYLHRVLGLSLRNIAEQGLMDAPPASRSGGKLGSSALRARMRTIERKIRRAAIETRPHGCGTAGLSGRGEAAPAAPRPDKPAVPQSS